ncbi:phage DNA packaging protein J [Streptomyces sp. Ncost-T10-10d]|uniref:phage DNA packaging protein J n=1 Tax=Streptomyces sp. Ncost-T10-10d TaxID=1839774 RepID=UPI000D1B9A71
MTASGLRPGRPAPVRGTRADLVTALEAVTSSTLPVMTTKATGEVRPSQVRRTSVVSAPRERPSARPAAERAGISRSYPSEAPFCGPRRRAGGRD